MDVIILRHASHVLEEVAPVTVRAGVGSIITVDLVVSVVDRKAGHVSEKIAPVTLGTGVLRI